MEVKIHKVCNDEWKNYFVAKTLEHVLRIVSGEAEMSVTFYIIL